MKDRSPTIETSSNRLRAGWTVILASILLLIVSACGPTPQPPAASPAPTSGSPGAVGAISNPPASTSPPPAAATSVPAGGEAVPTPGSSEPQSGINTGQRAPDFTLPSLDGGQVSLSQFRGKTVLINFWATWCPPCKEEMPALNDLYKKYQGQNFVVLAVDQGEDRDTVEPFVKDGGYIFPVVLDQSSSVSRSYQVVSLPTSYLVDADGIIRDRIIGAMPATVMEAKAQRFVGTGGQPPAQPGSVVQAAGAANDEVVATIGEEKVTMREVNRMVDLLLAVERIDTGAVLDPSRPSDQAELRQRQRYALDELINNRLLTDAARQAGMEPPADKVDEDLRYLSSKAGGDGQFAAELAKHGLTVADLRPLLGDWYLTNDYVAQVIFPQAQAATLTEAALKWLEAERVRRNVKILKTLE